MTHTPNAGKIILSDEFIWEVNMSVINDLINKIGDSISSPIFRIDSGSISDNWHLNFYPKSYDQNYLDHAALFLYYNGQSKIEIKFTFALLDQYNKKIFETSSGNVLYNPDKQFFWGFYQFYKLSIFMDRKHELLKDNTIRIFCKIERNDLNKGKIENKSANKRILHVEWEKLFTNKDYCDVTITAEEKTFHAHKCVLAIHSPVFDAMFKHDMKEKNESALKIKDIRAKVLQEVLKFIYTGTVENINDIVCELLTAAEKYSLEGLKMLCQQAMCDNIKKENAIEFLIFADVNNANEAKLKALNYIALNLDNFSKNPKFDSFLLANPKLMLEVLKMKNSQTRQENVQEKK